MATVSRLDGEDEEERERGERERERRKREREEREREKKKKEKEREAIKIERLSTVPTPLSRIPRLCQGGFIDHRARATCIHSSSPFTTSTPLP